MRADDVGCVAAIESDTLSPWSDASLKKELEIPEAIQLVAETSGSVIIGWCCCRVIQPEAELLKIAIKKESRGHGVASSLLHSLCSKLISREIDTLFLEVRYRNREAISLYKKNGFLQIANRFTYYTNPSDDALIFKKRL